VTVFLMIVLLYIPVLGHIAVYGTHEKAIVGVIALFALGNVVMISTGSGIFPIIFHSLFNMAQALKSLYATNEYAVIGFMVLVTVLWALLSASYLIIYSKTRKRSDATDEY